jgi:hypothetical protein
MFELYLSHTSAGEPSTDPRNQFHEVAMLEARIASDWHEIATAPVAATKPSFVSRLRLAFAGGPSVTTDACTCPA